MPGYKGHMLGACAAVVICVAALAWFGYRVSPLYFLQGLFFAWLGALFPDIDTKSKGQKMLYAVLFVLIVALLLYKKYVIASVLALMAFMPLFVNHRGIFHRFWFAALITAAAVAGCALQFPWCAAATVRNGLFFLLGFFSHIALDFGLLGLWRKR